MSATPSCHRKARGFSLFEVLVTIAIIALISSAVAISVLRRSAEAKVRSTRINAATIRHGIKTWWVDHDSQACPDVGTLVADGTIDRGKSAAQDAWQQPWQIRCSNYDAEVSSKGPDKVANTDDDIRVPD